jgi:predicted nuclease of predicted toxin-antitoxin system
MAEEIRFYTDEHVARAVIRGLRERGADVMTVVEAGLLGASDREHLERATQEGRVVFTQDTDSCGSTPKGFRTREWSSPDKGL